MPRAAFFRTGNSIRKRNRGHLPQVNIKSESLNVFLFKKCFFVEIYYNRIY